VMRGRKKRRAAKAALAAEAQAAQGGVASGPETAKPGKPPKTPKPGKAPKAKKQPKPKRRRLPKGPARQTRITRLVGLAFCIGGFVAIGFGWSGAAGKDCVPCQMPYVLSGGAAGIGLIVFGVGMMVMAQLRTEGRRLAERLGQVQTAALSPDAASSPPNGSLPSSAVVTGKQAPEPGEPSSEAESPAVTTPAGPG
jgi:hypothetical protein